jgi:hypothetical protein
MAKRSGKNPAAAALGRRGGLVTSEAKAETARANGAKGGRGPWSLCEKCGEKMRSAKTHACKPA